MGLKADNEFKSVMKVIYRLRQQIVSSARVIKKNDHWHYR